LCKCRKEWQSSLLFGLLALLCITGLLAITALVLYVLVVDGKSFINLRPESRLILDTMAISKVSNGNLKWSTYRFTNSELSISRSIPVILPANSGCIT
jgi:hypothetical protein